MVFRAFRGGGEEIVVATYHRGMSDATLWRYSCIVVVFEARRVQEPERQA